MTNIESRTETIFPQEKFGKNTLLEHNWHGIITRGRLDRYFQEGNKLIAVIRNQLGGEFAANQDEFTQVDAP